MAGRKVIVFGTKGVGKSSKDFLISKGEKVIAFADNESELWGKHIDNIIVISPEQINNYKYDFIVLGLFKNRTKVIEQLKVIGIPMKKIIAVIEPNRIYKNPCIYTEDELIYLKTGKEKSQKQIEYESWNIQIKDKGFSQQLERLKKILMEYNIPRDKICVVKGMTMVAHGIRLSKMNEDIDIIMTSDLRKLYGTGKIYFDDNIEIEPIFYMHGRNDDDIIDNPERHIIYDGIKFMTIKELYEYKCEIKLIRTEKKGLKEDLELIRSFLQSKGLLENGMITQFAEYKELP